MTLPGILNDVAEEVGADAAVKLALREGGRRIYVPRPDALKDDHPFVGLFGREAAARLCGRLQGSRIEVPIARREIALHLRAQGMPAAEIGAALRVSRRTLAGYFKDPAGEGPR